MKRHLLLLLVGIAVLFVERARAATITSETFSVGANGWQGSTYLEGSWTFTGGAARVRFPSGFVPVFSTGTLSNLTTASSGSFTGNYTAAGINSVGFRFNASAELPSGVSLWMGDDSNTYFRLFDDVTQTNVWYTLSASLVSPEAGGWEAIAGSLTNFTAVLQNVRFIAIRIARSGVMSQQFVIDDIFLGRQPTATVTMQAGGDHQTLWDGLISNRMYNVEVTTNLILPNWFIFDSFTATNTTHHFTEPAINECLYYRLIIP
jgi:hypothetical protein